MIDYNAFPSPCYVLDEERLERNLQLISKVQKAAGIEIILAFKGFAMWKAFPVIRQFIQGATASSLHEARLCFEEMKSLAHTYCPVYYEDEFEEIVRYSSHITFNSLSQFDKFKSKFSSSDHPLSIGLRVNPEASDVKTDLYNPSSPFSRLGVPAHHLRDGLPPEIEGLHFHTLCESDADALEWVLQNFETKFGHLLPQIKWVNMGGGHLMTRQGYQIEKLINILSQFKKKYNVHVILEPGSAFVWQTGELISTVMDIVDNNGVKTLLLDVSFTAHMPDTLEMPYRPQIQGATDPVIGKPTYRMGGTSCLAGDYLSEYSFDKDVNIGDRIILMDMMHYTMVKTTTFNGVRHPSIAMWTKDNRPVIFRSFTYEDFKNRLS